MAKRLTKLDIEDARIGHRVCASISQDNDASACFRHLARGDESRAAHARGPKRLVGEMLRLATAAKDAAERRSRR